MNAYYASTPQPTKSSPGKPYNSVPRCVTKATKLDVLRLLASLPGLNAAQMADRLRISPEASGMLLLRLTRAGLLFREPEQGMFVYTLTAKGHARHIFLAHRADTRTE